MLTKYKSIFVQAIIASLGLILHAATSDYHLLKSVVARSPVACPWISRTGGYLVLGMIFTALILAVRRGHTGALPEELSPDHLAISRRAALTRRAYGRHCWPGSLWVQQCGIPPR